MNTFVHIGFPKCLSTSLQRSVFARHPEIFYLGIATDGGIGYRTDACAAIFEFYLKYARRTCFRERLDDCRNHLQELMLDAERRGATACVVSSEHLSMSFTADCVDIEERAARLKQLFPSGCTILVLLRNQAALLKSIYRELVRTGYPGTFDDYVDYLFKFQEKNFVIDLTYSYSLGVFAEAFGKERVAICVYEDVVSDGQLRRTESGVPVLGAWLAEHLRLRGEIARIDHDNVRLTDSEVAAKRELNVTMPHDFGRPILHGVENHRLGGYWRFAMNLDVSEEELFRDVVVKRQSISRSAASAGMTRIDALCSERAKLQWVSLMNRFETDNRRLDRAMFAGPLHLPASYLTLAS